MQLPRMVIAGTESGVGKTTVTLGLMAALRRRGLRVGPYKVGPDYIDPGFHTFAAGRVSRNLDLWLLPEETMLALFVRHSAGSDLAVIEGVMGLYDGVGTQSQYSTAHIAKTLHAPVVLVIDGSGVAASAAAKVLGYRMYDPEVQLAGVIVNRVGGEAHYQLLREAIERDTGVRCYGYLTRNDQIQLKSRHLGLIPGIETGALERKLGELAGLVERSMDLDGLLQLAKEAVPIAAAPVVPAVERWKGEMARNGTAGRECLRIGVAYDEAFHFYYQDNLDLLEELGAALVRFSPLRDRTIPADIDGLYIGGGFPEVFAAELEANSTMRHSLASAIRGDLPAYAECGGLMYLCRAIRTLDGSSYEMVDVIPAVAEMTGTLQRFGYVHVTMGENLFHLQGTTVPGHEFHYSRLVSGQLLSESYSVLKRGWSWSCGIKTGQLLAGYPHLHFYSNPDLAGAFVQRCREYHLRQGRQTIHNKEEK